jgi:DNA modification methylase
MILQGDCLQVLKGMDDKSVQMCVTSPPYYGLRNYGVEGQIGLESTPDEYVAKLVAVFHEVKRVLKDDGTLFLNLGDSYATSPAGNKTWGDGVGSNKHYENDNIHQKTHKGFGDCKPKDLIGIPWVVAFALRADGWVLRSDIIWSKPNPMPESVKDRPTKSHEHIFLFSKAKWIGPEQGRYSHISDEDARWLAMFFETEGNISVKRSEQKSGRTTYGTQIAFANTSRKLLEIAQNIIGDGNIYERKGNNAPMFYYEVCNKMARDLLYRIYPYLIVKQLQGRLGIFLQDYISETRKRPHGFRPPEQTRFLEWAWVSMKSLNHFGRPDISIIPEPQYGRYTSQKYYYDYEAVLEVATGFDGRKDTQFKGSEKYKDSGQTFAADGHERWPHTMPKNIQPDGQQPNSMHVNRANKLGEPDQPDIDGIPARNLRDVWTITTKPYKEAHFATFPPEIPERCIKAGSKPGDVVLDPFNGSGTTGSVATRLGRNYIGIELNPDYIILSEKRLSQTQLEMI